MNLTEEDLEFITKVTHELQNYLDCLEKVGYGNIFLHAKEHYYYDSYS